MFNLDQAAAGGLGALSDNNPLVVCPIHDILAEAGRVTFQVKCPGGNAARGSAVFELAAGAFRGRIGMTMGGKNMTMTEFQSGRRIGPCP